MDKEINREEIICALRDLAFGRGNDAAKLAFAREPEPELLDGLDLKCVESVHRLNNGSVEIKLVDRVKLIELLLSATAAEGRGGGLGGLMNAISGAAERLSGDGDTGGDD